MDEKEIFKKWGSIFGGTSSKKSDWFSNYTQKYPNDNGVDQTAPLLDTSFPSILPIVMKVAHQTIGQNLVSVQPINMMSEEEIGKIKKEVLSENRDRKIESIVENGKFEEMKIEDHPDYKSAPIGKLFYLDFQYGTNSQPHRTNGCPI